MKKQLTYAIIGIIGIMGIVYFVVERNNNSESISDLSGQYFNDKISELESKLKSNPEDRDYFMLAFEYALTDNIERSLFLYEEYIQKVPTDTTAYMNIGDLYLRKKDLEKSAQAYLKVIDMNKKEMIAYPVLLDIYESQKSNDKIEGLIVLLKEIESEGSEGLNISGETTRAIGLLARAYKIIGNNEAAIAYYQKMIDNNLGDKDALEQQIKDLINN